MKINLGRVSRPVYPLPKSIGRFHRVADVVSDYALNIAVGVLLLLAYSIT